MDQGKRPSEEEPASRASKVIRTENPTQDYDPMEVDLPAYRPSDPVRKAWNTPMQKGVEFLAFKTVRDQWAANVGIQADYANFVSVCQSSGTGKSRMVDELGQYIFTIPFNVRADEGGGAYPLPDQAVRDYLAPLASYEKDYIWRCQTFFATLFRAISGFLIRCKREGSLSDIEMAHVWRLFLGENRETFYSELVGRSHQIARTGGDYIGPGVAFAQLEAHLRSDPEQPDPQQGFLYLPIVAQLSKGELCSYISKGKESAEEAKKALKTRRIPLSHDLKVVVYFDEAHTLFKVTYIEDDQKPTAETRKSMYNHILSMLNTLKEYGFFAIFLSTSPRIRTLAPAPSQAPGARQTDNRAPPAPITEIPFDCHPDLSASAGIALNQKLSTCRSIEFMAKFGRVLFWALLEGSYTPAQTLDLAKNKIAGYQYRASSASPRELEEYGKLACLDLRLSFDYDPRRDPDGKEEKLVENHMRLCYSVPTHGADFWSGYSSEPLLAEAAAQAMHLWRNLKSNGWSPVKSLADWMGSSLIHKGERGEIGGRFLLMSAYDNAVWAGAPNKDKFLFSYGCHVNDFIDHLFQGTHAATIKNCKPDIASSSSDPTSPPTFSEALGGGWIRFTHFGRLGDSTCGVSQVGLYAAFVRGMAYIGKPNQANFDAIIPVCLAKSDDFSYEDMTAIFVQFKARKVKGGHRYDYTAEDLQAFPEYDKALAYCTLLMELGIPPKDLNRRPAKMVETSQELRRSERRGNPSPPDPHLRYNIRAYGSTSRIYRPIKPEHQDQYYKVFQIMEPLNEHARQGAEHINQILTMKPEWTFNSLHWLQSEVPSTPGGELEEERVEAGPVTVVVT